MNEEGRMYKLVENRKIGDVYDFMRFSTQLEFPQIYQAVSWVMVTCVG
jgi:hypothetical protein